MHFRWFIQIVLISEFVAAIANKPGYVILVHIDDRSPLIFCLPEVAPNASQIFPSVWKPSSDPGTARDDVSNIKCNYLQFDSAPRPSNLNSDYNTLILFADEPGYRECLKQVVRRHPKSVIGRLPVDRFRQLSASTTQPNHTLIQVRLEQDVITPPPHDRTSYMFLFVYACAFMSIFLGCMMILVSWDKLLQQMRERSAPAKWSKWSGFLLIGLLVILASISLLIYYYLFDIAVYIVIALYCVAGAMTITSTLAFWIMYFIPPTKKRIPVSLSLCSRNFEFTLSVTELCILPLAVCVMIVWLVYRNNPDIGWPMQSVIGTILIARILSSGVTFPSIKLITVAFTVFLLFDVFFVFITPLLMHKTTAPTPTLPAQTSLERRARSTSPSSSVMEAVALGSAGKSGESIPLSFRLQVSVTTGMYQCSTLSSITLLGFGDAVFPGFLCAFVAFFDSVWGIRFRRNLLASLVGYILGIVIVQCALSLTGKAQPALLYLCPCTLAVTVAACGLFGGLEELGRMWNGSIPAPVDDDWINYTADPTQAQSDAKGDDVHPEEQVVDGDVTHSQVALVPRV